MKKFISFVSLLLWTALAIAQQATPPYHYQAVEKHYSINRNLTYTLTLKKIIHVNDASTLKFAFQDSIQYSPESESVYLLNARVVHANGSKERISKKYVHDKPVFSSQAGAGHNTELERILLFPNVRTGDTLEATWQIKQAVPPLLGLNLMSDTRIPEQIDKETIALQLPENLTLHWQKRGDVQVRQSVRYHKRLVTAQINDIPAMNYNDPVVTAKQDYAPLFMVSTLPSWKSLGRIYHRTAQDKARVTPEIKALAAKIVGRKKGKDAAKAIYDWVATQIKYVYLPLTMQAGFVPNPANDIVRNGFGDCKDHVTLMQALLAARGIQSEPVLVGWDNSFKPLPLTNPGQFNHVIIYLPKYHLYANPTSESSAFGDIDPFLSEKFVVHAGKTPRTAKTPKSQAKDNHYGEKTNLTLSEDGSWFAQGQIDIKGLPDSIVRKVISESQEKIDGFLKSMLTDSDIGGVGRISAKSKSYDPQVTIDFNWHSQKALEMADTVYFTLPRGIDFTHMNQLNVVLQSDSKESKTIGARTFDWHSTIVLPAHYQVSRMPPNREISNTAGKYQARYEYSDQTITIRRTITVNQDVYSGQAFKALKKVLQVAKYDQNGIFVLAKSKQPSSVQRQ